MYFLSEVNANVVVDVLATIGGEGKGVVDDVVPLLWGQSLLQLSQGDVVVDQSVDETGIEIVACADGRNGVLGFHLIALGESSGSTHLDRLGSVGVDEVLAVEGDFGVVNLVGSVLFI